jgi:hypothetical protein
MTKINALLIEGEVANLRLLADRLEAFGKGDHEMWNDRDSLAAHQAVVRISSHVAGARQLRSIASHPSSLGPAGGTLVRLPRQRLDGQS